MAWSQNTNKEIIREYDRKWRASNKEKKAASDKRYYDKLRAQIIEILGGCCVVCGTTEKLEFDHINNDGKLDRAVIEPYLALLLAVVMFEP